MQYEFCIYHRICQSKDQRARNYSNDDPTGPKRWEKFEFELACAELCGKGHYSMRRVLKVVPQDEFDAWYKGQKSFYETEVRGKDGDPNMGKVLDAEVSKRATEFGETFKTAVESADARTVSLSNVSFDGETAALSADSKYELDNLVTALNTFPAVSVAVSASGSEAAARAATVIKYLTDRGIGADRLKAGAAAESGVSLTISQ